MVENVASGWNPKLNALTELHFRNAFSCSLAAVSSKNAKDQSSCSSMKHHAISIYFLFCLIR